MTDELIKGFEDFKKYQYQNGTSLMPQLVEDGQSPKYFIISCIDSRANPGTIFRPAPGTFLAHKAMGAIVRPYKQGTALSAALQFALHYNKVDTVIVLGHTGCGAIQALAEKLDDVEISSFIDVAKHALARAQSCCEGHDAVLARTEQEVVLESAQNLRAYPSVAKALAENRLSIRAWMFDMKEGDLLEYNEKSSRFEVITAHDNTKDSRKDNS